MKNICFKDEILFVFVIYHNIYEFHKRVYLYFIDAYYVFILLSCFTIYHCQSGWVSRKLYQEKTNWPQAPVIILFEFLCYSIHDKIIQRINSSLYLWTNPFSLKWTVKNMVELLLKLKIKVKTNDWGKNIQILKPVTLFKDP